MDAVTMYFIEMWANSGIERPIGDSFHMTDDNLGGHLSGLVPIGPDPRSASPAVFNILKIPHSASQKGPDFSHAKGLRRATHFGSPRRTLPLQNATKNATNGKFRGSPRNATALVSSTYDTRAASRAEREGREHPTFSSEKQGFAAQGGAESGAVGARQAMHDPDLDELVRAWPGLPEAVRQSIMGLLRARTEASTFAS
jgi:hypothetical protein